MSSSPNGPPVAYAYITNTSGSSPALRIAARVAPPAFVLMFSSEMFADLRLNPNGGSVGQRVAHRTMEGNRLAKNHMPVVPNNSLAISVSWRLTAPTPSNKLRNNSRCGLPHLRLGPYTQVSPAHEEVCVHE